MTEQNDTNLRIWDALKTPPGAALKKIEAGRQKGKSNINAQWRMEVMTKQFGPCGIGWRYTIKKLWTQEVGSKGEVAAFAEVDVYVREGEDWSEAIPGIGGNMLVAGEKSGLHVNDECYKMAVTDALSVAFKALGVAAEVYLGVFDDNKYSPHAAGGQRRKREPRDEGLGKCPKCGAFMRKINRKEGTGHFLGCQGYPDCKYTAPPPKEGGERPAPKAAPPPAEPGIADLPRHPGASGAALVGEELCPKCGKEPKHVDGVCRYKAPPPQEPAPAQDGPPRCCDRNMMPRAGLDGGAPHWQCPICRKKRDMTDEERKRVGL